MLLSECDISLSEKELLARLHLTGGQLRMADVSNVLMFTEGGATKIIQRMSERGFVERQRSEEDRRVILISITEQGTQKLFDAIAVMSDTVIPMFTSQLSSGERTQLTQLLEKIDWSEI